MDISYDPVKFRAVIEESETDAPSTKGGVALGEGSFHYVAVQNPLFDFAGAANAVNVFVGTGGRQRWILRPGESTGWWPIDSLRDVFVRAAAGTVTVVYVACRLTPRKE